MAFCIKEKQLVDAGYTAVENKFFINYMPDAPDVRSAVYLLGLALSDSGGDDNSCQTIANKLNISAEEVMEAFAYWEELGVVTIVRGETPQIVYNSLTDSNGTLKKIKPGKYAKFSAEIQAVIEGRLITVNEYNAYYTFLEETTFDPEALVAVAKYCAELKGNSIAYQYILTVARNQIVRGATTLATVSDNLNSQQKYDDDLRILFKAMACKRNVDFNDRTLYEKWNKEYGFSLDVITSVAKNCKKGGMTKLDALLGEYYRKGALSAKEIEDYESEKTHLFELARDIAKSIGVYYQSLDSVVDEYVVPWLRKGYDDETLLAVAKYCFRSGIRTLAGLAAVVDKLYKNGVVNLAALDNYLSLLADTDEKIQLILAKCGLDRRVTPSDRMLYKTWTEDWSMPLELILYAAELSAGMGAPMSYVNRVLSDCKQNGVFTVEGAKALKATKNVAPAVAATAVIGKDLQRKRYTDEEISALFTALEEDQ